MSSLMWRDSWILLLLIPTVGVVVWWWRLAQTRRERWFQLVRGLALVCLIFAGATPSVGLPAQQVALVVVRDQSASMNGYAAQQNQIITALLAAKPAESLLGIVDVAGDAQVARVARASGDDISSATLLNRDATALADGLTQASALIPAGYIPRILVLSDGLETRGRALERVESLRARGIQVDAIPSVGQVVVPVAGIRQMSAPQTSQGQGDIVLTIDLESSMAQSAQLVIRNQNAVLYNAPIELTGSAQKVLIPITNLPFGWHRLEASLIAPQDDALPDNQRTFLVQRQGAPRILLLADPLEVAAPLRTAIAATGSEVTLVRPRDVSGRLTDMVSYDVIVLADTHVTLIPESVMQLIATAVEVHGRGFLWIGGAQSLGAGGFRRTPLQDIAALRLDPINPTTQKRLTLYLVIDRSGSMAESDTGLSRLDIAKESAYQALSMLNPQDNVGVVFFDETASWAITPQPLPNADDIALALGRFAPGGGTSIRSGLQLAANARTAVESDTHHIILLSDGDDSSRSDDIARQIAASNATLSTIALGDQAGVSTLARLAALGGGVNYVVANVQALPRIFLDETVRVSARDFVEEQVVPQIVAPDAMPTGMTRLPPVYGYNRTATFPDTRVLMQIDDETPLWAVRLVGRGQSAVWASDLATRWGVDWVNSGYVQQIMPALLAPLLPQASDNLAVSWQWYDDILEVDVTVRDVSDVPPNVSITDSNGYTTMLPMSARGAQRWVSQMPEIPSGEYVLNVESNGQQVVRGLVIEGRSELRNDGQGVALLSQIATQTGGRVYNAFDDSLWDPANATTMRRYELTPWLLLLAIILFVGEIAVRRLPLNWLRRRASKRLDEPAADEHLPPPSMPPPQSPPPTRVARLQKAKRRALD